MGGNNLDFMTRCCDIPSYFGNPAIQANLPPPPPPLVRKDQCTQVQINKTYNKREQNDHKHNNDTVEAENPSTHCQSYDRPKGKQNGPEQGGYPAQGDTTCNRLHGTDKTVKELEPDTRKILKPLFWIKRGLPALPNTAAKPTSVDANVDKVDVTRYQIMLFGGIDPFNSSTSDQHGKTVLQYNIKANNWTTGANMPGSRHHHSALFYSGKIYIIGGTRPAYESILPTLSDSVWSFDPRTLQWRNEIDLPYPRRDFGLVGSRNGIYVIGGEDNKRMFLASTILLPTGDGQDWVEVEKLRIARTGLAAACVGDSIFAAGGIVAVPNSNVTDSVEAYSLTTGHWTQITNLRRPRSFGKFCVKSESDIFIIGGVTIEGNRFVSLSSIDKYDPKTNEWRKEANMSTARHGHDVILLEEKILVFGGVSTSKNITLDSVECYSTASCRWITGVRCLPSPLSGMAAVVFI